MIDLLRENPLLLLFLVAAIGFPLGHVKIKGCSLGVSAVLFVGLVFGAIHPDLKIPELIYLFGLTLFVYTIGLGSGAVFFSSFRKKGIHETLFVIAVLLFGAAVTFGVARMLGLDAPTGAGLFAGSLNNTPALATVLDQLKNRGQESLLSNPVVGYSISYPFGVLGTILGIYLFQRLRRVDYAAEEAGLHDRAGSAKKLQHLTVALKRADAVGRRPFELRRELGWHVIFGRLRMGARQFLVTENTVFHEGDQIVIVGTPGEVERVVSYLGERAPEDFSTDRSQFDYRRVFVSNPAVAGRKIADLDFLKTHEVTITRIRRGDVELLPRGATVLELGDRIRVLCRVEHLEEVANYFGDSYRAISEIDILSFSTGLTLGIMLGLVPFPLAGGVVLKLGFAGGPLVMGLILGRLHRTGPLIWVLPYGATMTLRQIGLVMFLAGVGTRAGYSFFNTLLHGQGLSILVCGAVVTAAVVAVALNVGYRILRIPLGRLVGIVAGIQTQPAVLGFALEQTKNELPNAGYAMAHPIATITKIALAQVLLNFWT